MDKEEVLKLRKEKKLHNVVEERLKILFTQLSPDIYTLKEGYGVTSGRTDTTSYGTDGKIIQVEFIASENMVFRDVTNLHQSSADLAIAVLLDEKYDPKVPEAYYRANAKNLFPTLMMSDILDKSKEQYVLGNLNQLLQTLNKQAEKDKLNVLASFEDFNKNSKYPEDTNFFNQIAIFPRRPVKVLPESSKEEEIYNSLNEYGIGTAVDPLNFVLGVDWRFSHRGYYFNVKEPAFKCPMFTQLSFGEAGEIIFTLGDERDVSELWASGLPKIFNPTLSLSKALYSSKGYSGMLDIVIRISGIKDFYWIPREIREPSIYKSSMRAKKFYEGEVITEIISFSVEDLKSEEKREKLYLDLESFLQKNTEYQQ